MSLCASTSSPRSSPRLRALPLLLCVVALLQLVARPAHAHNWCTIPMTYNRNFPTIRCWGSECHSACPYIRPRNKMFNLPDQPAQVWARGQRVTVAWARNNHHGGFARFSIVPVPLMFSRYEHARFTWFHTCWQAGQYDCKKARHPCATDRKNRAFRRLMHVPTNIPDGDYVLGHVWYGGLHYKEQKGLFPDYYSCSFIRIRGGKKLTPYIPTKPFFFTGWGEGLGVRNGKCRTSSTFVGKCDRWGCRRQRAFYAVPDLFQKKKNGKRKNLPIVTTKMYREGLKKKTWALHLLWGNCNYHACCPRRCGPKCGGADCGKNGKNRHECCNVWINRSGRRCRFVGPPCMRH